MFEPCVHDFMPGVENGKLPTVVARLRSCIVGESKRGRDKKSVIAGADAQSMASAMHYRVNQQIENSNRTLMKPSETWE